jgi:hypothetical protein
MKVITIGRGQENDYVISDPGVSKYNTQIIKTDDGRFLVVDMGSVNGTYVNGKRITGEYPLKAGDVVIVANVSLDWQKLFAEPSSASPVPQKKSKGGWVLSIILGVVAVALLAGFATRGKAQKARPTSQIVATAKFSLSDQLYHAALTLLSVTATVCLFGAIRALLSVWMPPCVATVISVLLEVGGGCAAAAELPLLLGLPLAALSVSFSGVSVLLQSAAALKPSNIPIGPLVRQKILQALLSLLLFFLIPPFFLK